MALKVLDTWVDSEIWYPGVPERAMAQKIGKALELRLELVEASEIDGAMFYEDGSSYQGDSQNGLKSGYGVKQFGNGTIYKGYWLNDKMNGKGELTIGRTKQRYVGNFSDGLYQGHGQYTDPRGEKYVGE